MEEENNCQPARRAGRCKRSEVWDHFEQKAGCNYCKALLCVDPARDGTSCLKKHYEETCPVRHPNKSGRGRQNGHGSPVASSERQGNHVLQNNASMISKSTSDGQKMETAAAAAAAEDHFIRMIALHGFPSSMVEDKQFIRFVGMLCPDFKMPSRDDVEERCDALFDQETSSLKDAIARTSGLVSLSIGRARTAMVDTVYLAAHFIDDEWNLCRRVIRVFKDNAEIAGLVGDDTFQETVTSELFRTTLGMIYNAIETVAGSSSPTSNLSLIELVKLKIKKCTNASRRKDDNDDEDTDEEEIDDSDDEDRISEVQAAVVQLFQDYSNQGNAREHTNHNNENVMDIDPFHQIHNSTFQTVGQPSMEHDHRSSQESITELDAYLREKTIPIKQENFDIVKWWKENCHRYPIVARMVRDFLAIPTSTRPTPQMMTKIRNHLRRYA
ncbi:hypothetical protein OsJ_06108 [Oryza sativa Japonica Group]|uniref:HAT C-terminal dimerisation domain-containing protein n=2 Tax=Oryza sativa subsp. japonica TaxID=39947 RepID=A3A551_ORYSJ|nr:hypothetical protein OsJ_06108 [Oryza sativa Japonica Group]